MIIYTCMQETVNMSPSSVVEYRSGESEGRSPVKVQTDRFKAK